MALSVSKTLQCKSVFLVIRWKNVDGNDDVCQCCDSTCSQVWNFGANQRHLSGKDVLCSS